MFKFILFNNYISYLVLNFTADFDDTKEKRAGGGSVGLFPFPRVGRSNVDLLSEWDSPLSYNSLENYDGKENLIITIYADLLSPWCL